MRRRRHQLGLLVCIAVILAGCGGGGSGSGGDALGTKGSSTTGLAGSAPGSGGTGGSGTADAGADTDPTQAVQVGQGGNSACALTKGGRVRCWGYNESLGILSPSDPPEELPGISGAKAISVTSGAVCAIVKAGAVKCMGSGGVGQLGDGKKESTRYPYKPVDATGIKGATQISNYSSYQCAVLDNGEVKCWGSLPYGPGTDKFESTRPETVPGLKGATQVSVGEHGACALATGGKVWCWGTVGHDPAVDWQVRGSKTPVEVPGISGAKAVAGGGYQACAILQGGTVKCWGNFPLGDGQSGSSDTPYSDTPIEIPALEGATQIAMEPQNACAVVGGRVSCWGILIAGQDAGTTETARPLAVPGLTDAVQVSVGMRGDRAPCAVRTGGGVVCWGRNDAGQLGDGTSTDSTTPVKVVGFG